MPTSFAGRHTSPLPACAVQSVLASSSLHSGWLLQGVLCGITMLYDTVFLLQRYTLHQSVLWLALPVSYHTADAVYKLSTAHSVLCTVLLASCSRASEQGVCLLQARPDQARAEPLPADAEGGV